MSASDAKLFGEVFVTLFVIMDPPGTIPLFLSLTSGRSSAMRKRLAAQAVTVAFVVIVVFAHPAAAKRGVTVGEDAIAAMAAAGLGGLEVDHRDNPPEARTRLRALAADLDLLVTGASDYHGSGKENRLGENTTDPAVVDALLAQAASPTAVLTA